MDQDINQFWTTKFVQACQKSSYKSSKIAFSLKDNLDFGKDIENIVAQVVQDLATGNHKYVFLYIQIEFYKVLTSSLVIHTGWPKSKVATSNGCNSKSMHFWPYVGKAKMGLRSGSFFQFSKICLNFSAVC